MAKRKRISRTSAIPAHKGAGGRVWLYGLHAVRAALANPERVAHRLVASNEAAPALEIDPGRGLEPEILGRGEIDALLPAGAVHQGAALLCDPLPACALEDLLAAWRGLERITVLILDQARDPRNVGAVLRSCAGFAAAALIAPERHGPPVTGVLAKAASGALERVPLVHVGNLARALDALKAEGFWCAGLDAGANRPLAEGDLKGRIALVLGAEGRGLRRLTAERCDFLLRIPLAEGAGSLNLAAAAAIALYEANRG